MTESLLATKFHIPSTRPKLVPRPGLIEELNKGLHRKLTLISAPAGFGKTTQVAEWLDNLRQDTNREDSSQIWVAWLSLDEGDKDLVRFLTYFVTGLTQVLELDADFGKRLLNMLQSPQPLPSEAVLSPLINKLSTFSGKILLVLDDYHLIEAQPIHDALIYLLDYFPPQVHLVIISREDPPFQLARLRGRDQLTELRAADLRFTFSEAEEFLNVVMGLSLPHDEIRKLSARTEGWVTGLQLAAISLQGKDDPARLIQSFSGSHRFILDYLLEEVLEQQSDNVKLFLFKTAILERLNGSLCDALTDQDNGQETLEMLEHANLFLVPLDEERCWYRYHHLFSELLRQRLNQTQPEEQTILHVRASEWYEQNGLIDEAINHALGADDLERAAFLLEQHVESIWAHGEYAKLRNWLERLPDELVISSPQLSIFRAWELFANGQPEAGERFLQVAGLAHSPDAGHAETNVQNQVQSSAASGLKVRGRAAAVQAWIAAYRRDNLPGLIQHLRQALEYLPDDDLHWRATVAITLADTHAFNSDMPAAYQARLEALKACEAAGNTYLIFHNSVKLAINLKYQGQLQHSQAVCRHRMRLANESGMAQTAIAGWLLAIWADLLAETNDLEGALDLAEKSIKLTENSGDVIILGWSYLSLTRILFSRGDLVGAEKITQKMDKVARDSIVPTWIMNLNAVWQSRLWLAQDNLEAASLGRHECELDINQKLSYIDGLEYNRLARVLIAQGKWNESIKVLAPLIETAKLGGMITWEIELLILQAIALYSGGDTNEALATLEKVLELGESRGFYRIFVDEGKPMAHILYEALNRGIAPVYVRRLLQAFSLDEPKQVDPLELRELNSGYIEPLSEREIEILQLIDKGLTNQDIASRLFLSLHTVKTHIRNIYSKLDVHNRTQAIAKAKGLGILQFN